MLSIYIQKGNILSDIKATVQDQFARVAENYRTSQVHASGADLEHIAAIVQRYHAPTVLDVGCGAGHVSAAVAPWSKQVVAYDLTPQMLEQVQRLAQERQLSTIATRQGDVEHMPFADHSFEIVLSRYSAHHWPHPQRALQECLRVLKPGGLFLLSDIVAAEEPGYDTFLQTIELLRDRSHVRDHSISQWQAMFAQLGLSATVLMTWALPLNFQAWVTRMDTPQNYVQIIKQLFDTAPGDVRQAFTINEEYNFTIPGALFEVGPKHRI